MTTTPAPRNPGFVGREEVLLDLKKRLQSDRVATLVGPAGIGKTEVALEYARRFASEYHRILWLNAQDAATLLACAAELARWLELPLQQVRDSNAIIAALGTWLVTHTDYLLIVESAESLELVMEIFPARPGGQLLLIATMAAEEERSAEEYPALDPLRPEEGAILLLRRSGQLPGFGRGEEQASSWETLAKEPRQAALTLASELAGLPLALELVGAYLKETGEGPGEYLRRFYELRDQQKQAGVQSIAIVWQLTMERIETCSPEAADVLRVCAWLAAANIPLELFTEGASLLGLTLQSFSQNPARCGQAIEILRAYAVLKYNHAASTVSISPVIQTMLRAELMEDEMDEWEERLINALLRLLPLVSSETFDRCLRYLPQVVALHERWELLLPQSAQAFTWGATVLHGLAAYTDAIELLRSVLTIWESELGVEHPVTLTTQHNLAGMYEKQGMYVEAEVWQRKTVEQRERVLGKEHPDTIASLHNLAYLYDIQGKQEEAEVIYRRVFLLCVEELGGEHQLTLPVMYNLAILHARQQRFAEAEILLEGIYQVKEQTLGIEHLETLKVLDKLGVMYLAQRKWADAKELYQRLAPTYERKWGWVSPETADMHLLLATLYLQDGQLDEAEKVHRRAWEQRELVLGKDHPDLIANLNGLAETYLAQNRLSEAEEILGHALQLSERVMGKEQSVTAKTQGNIALLYLRQGKVEQAQKLVERTFGKTDQS